MRVELGRPFGDLGTVMQIDLHGNDIYVTVEDADGYLTEVNITELFEGDDE